MSTKGKIIFSMLLTVLLSIGGILGVADMQLNTVFIDRFITTSSEQLDRMNSFVNAFFQRADVVVETAATSPVIVNNLEHVVSYVNTSSENVIVGEKLKKEGQEVYKELLRLLNLNPDYAMIYVSSLEGGMGAAPNTSLPAGYDPRTRSWFIDAMRKNGIALTPTYISASGGLPVTTIAAPIKNASGKNIGVAGIDIELGALTKEFGSIAIGDTGYMILFDNTGQVVSDSKPSRKNAPEHEKWIGKGLKDLHPDAQKVFQELFNLKNGYKEVTSYGEKWLAYVKTTDENWRLVLLQEKNEIFSGALKVIFNIAQVGIGLAVIVMILAYFIAQSITNPLERIVDFVKEVANGNLHAQAKGADKFTAEIKNLYLGITSMVKKLFELIEMSESKVKEAEKALDEAKVATEEADKAKQAAEGARKEGMLQTAEQMSSIISRLTNATDRLSSSAHETEEKTKEQQLRVESTSTAVTEIMETNQEIAKNIAQTAQSAENAKNEAANGKELVLSLVHHMTDVQNKAAATQESLVTLNTHANEIGKIMNIISDIADQTNLLALNAAIEAARAGDAGRGFAVVADEVRKLAEKTVEATKEVDNAISNIQIGTETNVNAIQNTVSVIMQSTEVVNTAGESLADIEEMINSTANETFAIVSASEQQSKAMVEIDSNTNELNNLAENVSQKMATTYSVSRELSALTSELEQIIEDLKK